MNQEDILEAVIEKVIADDNSRTSLEAKRKMIVNLIATSIQSDATKNQAFESLISAETLDKLLQGESNSNLELAFKRNFNNNDSVSFLSNVVARTDLSQASRIKEIVSFNQTLNP